MTFFSKYPTRDYRFLGETQTTSVADILRRVGVSQKVKDDLSAFYKLPISGGDAPDVVSSIKYNDPALYWVLMYMNDRVDPYNDWVLSSDALKKRIETLYPGSALFVTANDIGSFITGETVTFANTKTATVLSWDPTYRKLVVDDYSGDDISETASGTVTGGTSSFSTTVQRVISEHKFAVHHFQGSVVVDGETVFDDQYLNPLDYISGYLGGSETAVVTNEEYESALNDAKRSILILDPNYLQEVYQQFTRLINL